MVLYMISVCFVISGLFCLLVTLFHIYPRHRQNMKIMEAVWSLTSLWATWPGLWAYLKLGKSHPAGMHMKMSSDNMPQHPQWQMVTLSTLHCGAGCTLADLVGELFTSYIPVSIGGSLIAGQWTLDYILALLFGIYFQYAAIRPMETLTRMQVIKKAFKIDFFSLTAWQTGIYGWMAILMFGIFKNSPLSHLSWQFWFMMQIAMYCGFLTSYPANWILIKLGIKKGM